MISLTSPVETAAHRWPVGGKFAALSLATVVLFAVDPLLFHVVAAIGVLALYAVPGRVFFIAGLRMLWRLWPFVIGLLAWNLWQGRGPEGVVVVLRMLSAVGLANLVTMTSKLSDMIAFLSWLLTPLRRLGLKTRPIELAIALAIRFTPVLMTRGGQLSQSWRARSPRRAGWRVVMPLAVLALDDAEQVAEALKARGGVKG